MLKILSIITPIFILIGLGFVAVRAEFFPKASLKALGAFVINFALPALLFKALSQRSFAEIMNAGYLVAYSLGSLTVMSVGISIAFFRQKKTLSASALGGLGMSCSNSGFIGYPIVSQLIGAPAAVALALTMIVENVLVIPIAIVLAESGTHDAVKLRSALFKSFAGLIKSPIILAIIAGFTFATFELHPPEPVARAIDMLALSSASVALFVIGGTLVGLQIRGMIRDVVQIVTGKLLFHPLAVFMALMLFPALDPNLRIAAVTFASVPMLSIYPIFGQRYGEEEVCAAALMAATVASFLSISAVLAILHAMGILPTAS